MKRLTAILVCIVSVASCSQITTNKSELAGLKTVADTSADAYVACVVEASVDTASQGIIDVASAVTIAEGLCQSDLNQFKNDQEAYLGAQVMMTAKPLQQSVDALNDRATVEVGEAMLAAADSAPAVALPVAAAGTAAATSSLASTPAQPANGWNADQRVYLDCMEDQGRKYSGVQESAGVIADVAQSRCKSYIPGSVNAALEQEGRTLVMGMVLDAKLQGPGRTGSQPSN